MIEAITREEYMRRAATARPTPMVRRVFCPPTPLDQVRNTPRRVVRVDEQPTDRHWAGCDGTHGRTPDGFCQLCGRR